ncbi:lipid A oxidase (Involved in formation of 2-aminogluconate) protein [Devosia pacifica]|uniref:Lipid A oxidase (Involved in formation of 2-aminogluconate) protein n=1 Tax=Devosia pacifica TaxID=1335967 RepID=A0A918VUT2_9HYPH|nr:lipid A oxidase [Devosia pacifica]GHA31072.1 lipid A oxidase (Involved in formation of 2-aminogluconate) protein [Devosia pacifica]
MRYRLLGVTVVAATMMTAGWSLAGSLEIGVYGGLNESLSSTGTLSNGVVEQDYDVDWQGLSFDAPIYYGANLTLWPDAMPDWGFQLDFTHAKAYADFSDPDIAADYSRLEFTHGLNLVTANVLRKWETGQGLRFYAGGGAGVAVPHVEIETRASSIVGDSGTFEYQAAGPALQGIVGASFEVLDNLRLFGQYKLSYAPITAELSDGSSSFSTDFVSHHVAAGLSYSFDSSAY